jgi:adenosine deaminase
MGVAFSLVSLSTAAEVQGIAGAGPSKKLLRVTVEICLTSNMQTNPAIKDIEHHSFSKMIKHKLSTAPCTDNRRVSKTTVPNEVLLAIENVRLSAKVLKNCVIYGFKRSNFPGNYDEKRKYVRQFFDYYEKLTEGIPGIST